MFHTIQTTKGPVLVRVASDDNVTALYNMRLWRGRGPLDGSTGLVAVLPSVSNASLTLRPKGSKRGMVTLEYDGGDNAPADRLILCAWIAELHAELDRFQPTRLVAPRTPTTTGAIPPVLRQAATPSKRPASRSLLNPHIKM